MATSTYSVLGMTCGHCAAAVTEEIRTLPGVTEVGVDLEAAQVTVVGDPAPHVAAVRTAVEGAGYELSGPA